MNDAAAAPARSHSHVFLGEAHETSERRTWAVIALCVAMMILEIVGGLVFGSIALVADGLHMSTHAGALLLAALAYTFARKHARDPKFTFGTGKFGDLAGFSSAVVLAMIAILIGYEAVVRLFAPVPIAFDEAIPIAILGLVVNVASAWLLSGGHHHGHSHGPSHGRDDDAHEVHDRDEHDGSEVYPASSEEQGHEHGGSSVHRDNNMRAAVIHVMADAAVSVLVIAGLILAYAFHWTWMDPLAGLVGALVIASWSYGLVRDTGSILLDVNPEPDLTDRIRRTLEIDGDQVSDLHLWRLGPGHLGAIAAISTTHGRDADYYRRQLSTFPSLAHLTVEVAAR